MYARDLRKRGSIPGCVELGDLLDEHRRCHAVRVKAKHTHPLEYGSDLLLRSAQFQRSTYVAPGAWRETMQRVLALSDGQLRFMGLAAMLSGMALLIFAG